MTDHKENKEATRENHVPWFLRITGKMRCVLTEFDSKLSPPTESFRGTLWAPQETMLAAMVRLERLPFIQGKYGSGCGSKCGVLHVPKARLAARFSFGKTVLCVALICAQPGFPTIMPRSTHESKLVVRFRRALDATLVVVASSVVRQWQDTLARFAPHLRVFTVHNVWTAAKFRDQLQAGELDGVDVVLARVGSVTSEFSRSERLVRAVHDITEGLLWKRVIVDDYDTIRLTHKEMYPAAGFTWVVSATDRKCTGRRNSEPSDGLSSSMRAQMLNTERSSSVPVLRCSDAYVSAHISTHSPVFRRIVVRGGLAADIMAAVGIPPEVVEMVAAGATSAAAHALGIVAGSTGELLRRLLERDADRHRAACVQLARVGALRRVASRLPPHTEDEPEFAARVRRLAAAIKYGGEDAAREASELVKNSPAWFAVLSRIEARALTAREEASAKLRRARENVQSGDCLVCAMELDGEAYIVNCCQVVICEDCVAEGEGHRLIKRCPSCAAAVDPATGLIQIQDVADLEEIGNRPHEETLEQAFALPADDAAPDEKAGAAPDDAAPDEKAEEVWNVVAQQDARMGALLQLVTSGNVPSAVSDRRDLPSFVSGLLDGRTRVARPPETPQKFLIFAMHPESAGLIMNALGAAGIPAERLMGRMSSKAEAISVFREDTKTRALVTTSSHDCSGIHLPETTMVILYHHHVSQDVARQCVGRAQRVGRSCSLEIVEIMDEGEARRHL